MMKHSMKLRVALALSMLIQPLYAGQKIEYAQKTAKVLGYTAMIFTGISCVSNLRHSYDKYCVYYGPLFLVPEKYYHYRNETVKYRNETVKYRNETVKYRNETVKFSAVVLFLLYSGLSGLDRELHLRKYAKQFFDRAMKRVRTVSKK